MPRHYKVTTLSASAIRPSVRSRKAKRVKNRLTLWMLVLVIAAVGIYALVQHVRTDPAGGGVEIVVGSQLMACIEPEEVKETVTVTEALERVSVRPSSMQTVVLSGDELNLEIEAAELESMYLISGEKEIMLTEDTGAQLGAIWRIYLPIDE